MNSDPGSNRSWRMKPAILLTSKPDDRAKTTEHGVRGRPRVDCIGRMVMRPSNREIASQPVGAFVPARLPTSGTISFLMTAISRTDADLLAPGDNEPSA